MCVCVDVCDVVCVISFGLCFVFFFIVWCYMTCVNTMFVCLCWW